MSGFNLSEEQSFPPATTVMLSNSRVHSAELLGFIQDAGTSETDDRSVGELISVNVLDDAASYE